MLRFHRNLPALSCPKKTSAPKTQLSPIQPQSQSPHSAPFHTARCIGLHSTLHRPTLHGASPHAPRSIKPSYSEPIFSPYEMPVPSSMLRCHRNLPALSALLPAFPRPFLFPSRPVCCDSIATCPRFPPAFRLLSALPAFTPPSACLPICPLPPPVPCLAWPEYRKSPPRAIPEGF